MHAAGRGYPAAVNVILQQCAPLYVVVEESWGSTILKWVRTLLWVGLAGYFMLVILTMVVEMTGSFRTRANQNNEVQAQHQTVRFSDVHGCDEAKDELQELRRRLLDDNETQKLAVIGLGGIGKTQIALEFSRYVKRERPEYSVFWVPAVSYPRCP